MHAPSLPPSRSVRRPLAFLAALAVTSLAFAREARAEEGLIKNPGEHPEYIVDLEPHGLLGWGPFSQGASLGVGARATFIIVQNGFVKTINNSVGVGVGADLFFNANRHRDGVALVVPVVMQWNFWLSTHWAVFGEPGVGVGLGSSNFLYPVFAAGGRYHLAEKIALTLRIGYPAISVGASFYF